MSDEDRTIAADGKLAIALGSWFMDKLHYLKGYCDIFSTGMKNSWEHRIYIDLFSGPGICVAKNTGIEQHGSPLISLNCKSPFTHYYFIDENKDFIETLEYRAKDYQYKKTFINKDCNCAVMNYWKSYQKLTQYFLHLLTHIILRLHLVQLGNLLRKDLWTC